MRVVLMSGLALALLAGCAQTPLQECQWPLKRDLGTVRDEIKDTELTLRRGFRLEPARSEIGAKFCETSLGHVRLCFPDDEGPFYDKRRINRAAESAKLATLRAEEARLSAGLTACAARYPE